MKRYLYPSYFGLATLEGILALLFMLRAPSIGGSSRALGYSTSQLAVSAITLVLVLLCAGLTLKSLSDKGWLERTQRWLADRLVSGDRLLILILVLLAGLIVGLVLCILWQIPSVKDYDWYVGVFKSALHLYEVLLVAYGRLYPLFVWGTLLVLQTLVFLLISFTAEYRREGFWDWQVISRTTLVLGMISLSVAQWAVLALRISMQKLLPGWYWDINLRPIGARHIFFILLLALSLGLVTFILRHPRRVLLSIVILIGLGYLLQVGFGLIEGSGYEYVRMKYADSKHRSYALVATGESPQPLDVILQYEEKYGWKMFPGTKPPGVVFLYVSLEKLINRVAPQPTAEGRFLVFTQAISIVFPLVSFLVLVFIYLFIRPLVSAEDALLPSMLYVFIPSVVLIPLFLDQVLYPLLFTLAILLMWRAIKVRSYLLAFLVGLFIYLAIFFTFSLLTLIPLFLVLLGLDFIRLPNWRDLPRSALMLAALGVGILVLFLLFQYALSYDFFQRYDTAMRIVRNFDFVIRTGQKATVDLTTTTVQPGLQQILRAAGLNNLELAAAVGFPVFLLFLWRAARTMVAILRRRAGELDYALGALVLTYIALNLYGQVQGEVSRLWIFWVPMMVLCAGVELASQFVRRERAVLLVVTLQLITMLMIFQFQDFVV
ncbi:MAG: hypothetical protein A2W33_10220 [Chloroflexi bacterium RBG_16_52_11]|nr:MAG: hypothetical protein A2W33_10220 [Chloroflexi bacterium RBG_16_52_11]